MSDILTKLFLIKFYILSSICKHLPIFIVIISMIVTINLQKYWLKTKFKKKKFFFFDEMSYTIGSH